MMSHKVDSSVVHLRTAMFGHDDCAIRPLNTLKCCVQACRAQLWGSCWHRRTFQTLSWLCPQQSLWFSWPWGAPGWQCSGVTGPQWIPERCCGAHAHRDTGHLKFEGNPGKRSVTIIWAASVSTERVCEHIKWTVLGGGCVTA